MEILGTLEMDGSLKLDHRIDLPPGRVKVHVEPVKNPADPDVDLITFVRNLRDEAIRIGYQFRSKEEIDRDMEEIRSEWE